MCLCLRAEADMGENFEFAKAVHQPLRCCGTVDCISIVSSLERLDVVAMEMTSMILMHCY